MSLKLKCNACGFLLNFEVQNPGVISVDLCECCIQPIADREAYSTGEEWHGIDYRTPDMLGERRFSKIAETINAHHQQKDGMDDGNDWRPVKAR